MDAVTQIPEAAEPQALRLPSQVLLQRFGAQGAGARAQGRSTASDRREARQCIRIGALRLLVRDRDGSHLADVPPIHPLPGAAPCLLGVVNLQGHILPVFDLGLYCGLGSVRSKSCRLLVLGHGEEAAGILIDGLPQRHAFDLQDSTPPAGLPEALAGCVSRAFVRPEGQWFDLDVVNLLDRLAGDLGAS